MSQNQERAQAENSAASLADKGLIGVFSDLESAENGYRAIEALGYDKDDINLIMSERAKDTFFKNNYFEGDPVFEKEDMISESEPQKVTNVVLKDAAIGAAVGGTVGAVLGAIAAIGTTVIVPGLGLVIAGPIATGIVSATGLGIGGGMIGSIFGFEVPDTHTTIQNALEGNHILLAVHPKNQEQADTIHKEWLKIPGVLTVIK